ncbi:MAG TPA: DUF3179 domain-containing (seleno)protein [Egibacteraceae bacterium]|nr:DUF3179 domain-containing (seleno)protein [Egibacteraceae bacterium]
MPLRLLTFMLAGGVLLAACASAADVGDAGGAPTAEPPADPPPWPWELEAAGQDVIDDRPVLVTYCPLCNSGLAFAHPGRRGAVVRHLRAAVEVQPGHVRPGHPQPWSQFTGEAIVGDRLGDVLDRLPLQIVAWEQFVAGWPDGQVLSRDTGHNRDYGRNPYVGYDASERPFLFDGDTGGPLPQMERVVATGGDEDPVAYPLTVLTDERVVHDEVAGEPVVVWWTPGTASALDRASIDAGADVGATGVFRRTVDGLRLTFAANGDSRLTDAETDSTWTVLGVAVDGPLAGTPLERIPHDDTFWFAQFAFRPETRVLDAPAVR